jgi:glycosyltransferase involved in cell wall biosynthesis
VTAPALAILLVGDYPDDPRLGSAKVFYKLQEEFQAAGHTCDILWSGDIGARPAARQIRQLVSPWMAGRAIVRQMDGRRYDVVDAASAEGLFLGLIGLIPHRDRPAFVCRSNGLEHLNYARMLDDDTAGLRRKSSLRRLWYPASRLSQVAAAARLADHMIVLNECDRGLVLERGWQPATGVTVVPHGISGRFLADAPAPGAPRGAGLLFCGTWDHVKGIAYLVEAINTLHESGSPLPVTVLGPGVPADRVLASFNTAVRPFVTVIDRAGEERVMAEYRRHDALLWTSTYEGFGMVVIEAMSQRLPIVGTPAGCADRMVRDGETGVRVPYRDAGAVAAAVRALMADAARRRRLGDAAHDAVAGMTWAATAARTIEAYAAARRVVRA